MLCCIPANQGLKINLWCLSHRLMVMWLTPCSLAICSGDLRLVTYSLFSQALDSYSFTVALRTNQLQWRQQGRHSKFSLEIFPKPTQLFSAFAVCAFRLLTRPWYAQ